MCKNIGVHYDNLITKSIMDYKFDSIHFITAFIYLYMYMHFVPSMFRCCWMDDRKGNWPINSLAAKIS